MKLGFKVKNFNPLPYPKKLSLNGNLVKLKPFKTKKQAKELYQANLIDTSGVNWTYLPYGPFDCFEQYLNWFKKYKNCADPYFFAIMDKKIKKAIGVASYLNIKANDGSIEVGHIHYSPLLQATTQGTEAMFLMMKWAFENGYRRYEYKCNSLNQKSRQTAQRLGFSYEGTFRQAAIVKQRNRDTSYFALIDKDYPKIKKCFEKYLSKQNFDAQNKPIISLSSLTKPLLYKLDETKGL